MIRLRQAQPDNYISRLFFHLTPTINIAALVPYQVYPAKMGGQKGIALFYQYLSKLLPITMISTKNNAFPKESNMSFLPLLSNSRSRYINPFLFFSLKKVIQKKGLTHLIIEHPYYGWLGMLLKWSCNIKLVLHSHNIESLRFKSTGKWWWQILFQYEKQVHRKADINFFITDEDRSYAINKFKLDPSKCHTITYGFELDKIPAPEERDAAKTALQRIYHIDPSEKIFFFNGTLDYKPNMDAVNIILNELNPGLLQNTSFKYKIIICGKNLPESYNELKAYQSRHIIYAGFVDDISTYFKGADCFLNPMTDGGGIKTKLVEALGYNLSCISTRNGAIGVSPAITGNKLTILQNGDWGNFTNAIFEADTSENIPALFFDHFYWGNIAEKAAGILDPS